MTKGEAELICKGLSVGQTVKIRERDECPQYLYSYVYQMREYEGITTTITSTKGDYVLLKCDDNCWCWSPDMFEIVTEEKELKREEDNMKNVTFNGKSIKRVIFNGDATIALFDDGTKAVTKRLKDDVDDKEKALAMALVKSVYGSNYFVDIFERFIPKLHEERINKPIQVGDRVRIKTWEQMKEEFEVDYEGDIELSDGEYFYSSMKHLCGLEFVVGKIDYDGEIYADVCRTQKDIYNKLADECIFAEMLEHVD